MSSSSSEDDIILQLEEDSSYKQPQLRINDDLEDDTVPLLTTTDTAKPPENTPKLGEQLKKMAKLARTELLFLSLGTIALVLSTASFLVIPKLMGDIIDSISKTTEDDHRLAKLTKSVIGLVIFFIAGGIFTFARATLFTIAGERVVARLRKQLFASLTSQEIAFFDVNRTGELVNRLSSDCTLLQEAVTINISMGLRWLGTALGGMVILFFISWKLTLVMMSIFPIIGVAARIYGKFIRVISKKVQDALGEATTVAEESLSNIRTVRAFSAESFENKSYSEKVDHSFNLGKKRAVAMGLFQGGATAAANLAITGVLWYGGYLVIHNELGTGTLTSFILYTINVGFAFGALSGLYVEFMKAIGASERVFDLLYRKPLVRFDGGQTVHNIIGNVKFESVTFNYPTRTDFPVLSDINLELKPGRVIALVGPSGGGKTTIVNLIEQFYYPQEGRITLDGIDLKSIDPHFLHKHIGIVSQEPSLFACTIADNITYGCDPEDFESDEEKQKRIVQAAKMSNAHEFITSFPQTYETLVGERGVRLSGGQKQRIAIARALIRNPKILLLDEATSALDAESEYLVKEALDTLLKSPEGRSVLVIAHRLSTVQNADEVVVIEKGCVVEKGTHEELINKDGIYKKLVSRQLQKT
eukprot:TRINITY_DN7461_c0_g1_i1.p1 TRINITY_DN7461_c0_g1~~TRINITY_DN7461_c0_g1_i1.p1  ORF type:complete len:644 (+),score=127.81 TRINITY_DN7461_c0_g1_i1:64-1995(+)